MSEKKLLPCPFCGGEAKRITLEDEGNSGGDVIACTKCDACSMVVFGEKEYLHDAWNRRVSLPDTNTLISLLAEARGSVSYHRGMQNQNTDAGRQHAASLSSLLDRLDAVIASSNASAPEHTLTPAAAAVLAERRRQVEVDGWTHERDEGYDPGQLSAAAGCYALHAYNPHVLGAPIWWPWSLVRWRPGAPRRNLVKAGALILAEIERLDRAAALTGKDGNHG